MIRPSVRRPSERRTASGGFQGDVGSENRPGSGSATDRAPCITVCGANRTIIKLSACCESTKRTLRDRITPRSGCPVMLAANPCRRLHGTDSSSAKRRPAFDSRHENGASIVNLESPIGAVSRIQKLQRCICPMRVTGIPNCTRSRSPMYTINLASVSN